MCLFGTLIPQSWKHIASFLIVNHLIQVKLLLAVRPTKYPPCLGREVMAQTQRGGRWGWALGKESLTQTDTAQALKGHFLISPPVTAVLWTLLPMCRLLTTAGFGSWRTGRFTCPLMALLCLHNTWLSLCRWSRCKTLPSRFGRVWWAQIVNARRSG